MPVVFHLFTAVKGFEKILAFAHRLCRTKAKYDHVRGYLLRTKPPCNQLMSVWVDLRDDKRESKK